MLAKVLKAFSGQSSKDSMPSLSLRSETSSDHHHSSTDSRLSQSDVPKLSLLGLPFDIFSLITRRLLLSDLISLSLTTKSLRHICPKPKVHAYPPDNAAEAKCLARIHLRHLPPAPPAVQEKTIRNTILPWTNTYRCPYCSHPLCPPSCSTALLLDTSTGIFYPSTAYNIPKAIFKYSPKYTSTFPREDVRPFFKVLSRNGYHTHVFSEVFVYSTIWCAHHRCPRGLLIPNPKSDRRTHGARLFLEEYKQFWGELRFLIRVKAPQSATRWSIWAQDLAGYELTMQPIRGGAEYSTRPVYEYAFYETMCRHCNFVCKEIFIWSTVFERVCRCAGHTTDLGLGGCRRCGLVSLKFEVVEPFSGDERKLAVATEWKQGMGGRMVPIDPEKRAKQLEIVRGRKLIDVKKGKVGIMDLPAGVLRRIMKFVALQGEDSEGQPYEMLVACYWFAKVWYELEFHRFCERFELLEGIMNEKRGKRKGVQSIN
ncbi:hypothetical protein TWF730_006324 [Orbilia blumenaviensis]|uniref:F-box domain-containing protein n=1 Tax=Orbilia blumenaviensis TaxID=1796055 RepID=A0AAV9VEG4_9PEZI